MEPQLLVAPFYICATPLWEAGPNYSIYIVVFKLWQPCIFNGPTLRLAGMHKMSDIAVCRQRGSEEERERDGDRERVREERDALVVGKSN